MLPSLRRAANRLASSAEPVLAPCTCRPALLPAGGAHTRLGSYKGKEVVRRLQTRSLSSSTLWASQPLASTSALGPSAAAPLLSAHADFPSATNLDDLDLALRSKSRAKLLAVLNLLDDDSRAALSRQTFDSLFNIIGPGGTGWSRLNSSRHWKAIKILRALAEERGWTLRPPQVRKAFAVGVKWEKERMERQARGETGDWNTLEKEQLRRRYLDDLRIEFLALERSVKGGRGDLELLTEYARAVLARDGKLDALTDVYRQALEASPPPSLANNEPPPHFKSALGASSFLPSLFHDAPRLALTHLLIMLDARQLPTVDVLQQAMLEHMTSPDEAYARAREMLDAACANGSRKGQEQLDKLMDMRLHALEREEAIRKRPMLTFLRWIAGERKPREGMEELEPSKEEWLLLALRLWEAVYAAGGEEQPKSWESMQLLLQLVGKAAPAVLPGDKSVQLPSTLDPLPPPPSPTLVKAIDLAIEHLPIPDLVSHSHRLLRAVTITSHSPALANHLYFSLRRLAPLSGPSPFQWHAKQQPLFISLVLSAASANDPAFVIQLYLEWTAAGMTYPDGIWTTLWRALGSRSDVDEIARVVADYEEARREVIPPRVVSFILIASASQPHYLRTLRLLEYFRERIARPSPTLSGSIIIPLGAYDAILRRLASTYSDRRPAALQVFASLVRDGWKPTTDTWNALLAGQVFRPKFHVQDVDNAGAAYNALVRSGCKPDSMTFSLLVFGFLRLARGREKRTVGVEAALRMFWSAVEEARGGLLVRGQQVAGLVRVLGERGRFEDAKGVAERWWRGVVEVQEREGRRFGTRGDCAWLVEMEVVEEAQRDLITWEQASYSKVDLPSTEVEEVDALAGDEGEDRPTPLAEEEGEDDQADSPVAFPLRETQHS